jgi:hypothetical protein
MLRGGGQNLLISLAVCLLRPVGAKQVHAISCFAAWQTTFVGRRPTRRPDFFPALISFVSVIYAFFLRRASLFGSLFMQVSAVGRLLFVADKPHGVAAGAALLPLCPRICGRAFRVCGRAFRSCAASFCRPATWYETYDIQTHLCRIRAGCVPV